MSRPNLWLHRMVRAPRRPSIPLWPAVLALVAVSLLATAAMAQSAQWNRRVSTMSIQPDGTGGQTVFVPVEILVANPGLSVNLSTALVVQVNGTAVANFAWSVESNDPTQTCSLNCGNDCGPLYVDGVFNTMTCHEDADGDCQCGYWLTAEVPGLDLALGDLVIVSVSPTAAGDPEMDTTDDILRVEYDGTPIGWDRELAGVAIRETATGHEAEVLVDLRASGVENPMNLSAEIELDVNGVQVGDRITWHAFNDGPGGGCGPGCGIGCGGMYIDGVLNTMTCHLEGPGDCSCGYWLTADLGGLDLQPGDEIVVILRPAPGALPDPDLDDNRGMLTYAGRDEGWDRRLRSVSVVPIPGSNPQAYDVFCTADLRASGFTNDLDLSTEVEIRVNGTTYSVIDLGHLFDGGPTLSCGLQCGSDCGPLYIDGVYNTKLCRETEPDDCQCGYWLTSLEPGVELQTGDEIMVILRPAPGAVPDSFDLDTNVLIWHPGDGGDVIKPGWVRSIDAVQVTDNGPDGHTVDVDCTVGVGDLAQFQPLGYALDLEIDGAVVSTLAQPLAYQPTAALVACQPDCSGGDCGTFVGEGGETFPASCGHWPGFDACTCGVALTHTFSGISIPAGATVVVVLRPAPAALPTLPGFEDGHRYEWSPATSAPGESSLVGRDFALGQNHPNPFNPSTDITFRTPASGRVRVAVFDARGVLVRSLVDESRPAGQWTVTWDGRDSRGRAVASGSYFCHLVAGAHTQTRVMTLVR